MKRVKKSVVFLTSLAWMLFYFWANPACAKLFVELGVGYSVGSQMQYTAARNSYVFDATVVPLKVTVGQQSSNGFFYGANLFLEEMGILKSTGVTENDKFSKRALGIEAGFNFDSARVLCGFDLVHQQKIVPNSININSPTALEGTALVVGAGYRFSPKLGIDLVYKTPSLSKITGPAGAYTNLVNSSISVLFNFWVYEGSGN